MILKYKSLKSNSIWNISNHLFSVISLFFLFPFLIKNIGAASYGFFIFLSTINGIASVANFGFGEATLRYVALYYTKNEIPTIKNILSTSLLIYIVLGAFVGFMVYLLAPQISDLLKEKSIDSETAIYLIRVSAATFIVRFTFGIFAMVPQALQRFDISSKITIGETILRVALYVIVILKGYGLTGLVYSELLLALIYVATNYLITSSIFKKVWFLGKFSKDLFKQIFSYSIYAALSQIVGLLWQYTDRILLGYFIGSAAIAYFSVPQQIIFKILGVIAAGAAVLFPKFSVDKINEDIKLIFKKYTLLFLMLSIILFSTLSLIIPEFLALWISPEFAEQAKDIAIILAVSCMIRGAAPVYMNLFKGIGKPVYNLYAIISSSLIIVVLDLILIPIYGINGAGIAYLVSPLPIFLIFYLIYTRIFNESAKEALVLFVVPLLLGYSLIALGILIKARLELWINWISLFSQVILFTAIILTSLWFYFAKIVKRYNNIMPDFKQFKKDFITMKSKFK
jgi:O-antigen/teichoic acid export membrane protein